MKLKEWGLMRHKPRGTIKHRREARQRSAGSPADCDGRSNELNTITEDGLAISTRQEHCTQSGSWQVVADLPTLGADKTGEVAEPTFMELMSQTQE